MKSIVEQINHLEQCKLALDEWSSKTEWVQERRVWDFGSALGMHRADVMRRQIECLEDQVRMLRKTLECYQRDTR
jgi:hypothetical protein